MNLDSDLSLVFLDALKEAESFGIKNKFLNEFFSDLIEKNVYHNDIILCTNNSIIPLVSSINMANIKCRLNELKEKRFINKIESSNKNKKKNKHGKSKK